MGDFHRYFERKVALRPKCGKGGVLLFQSLHYFYKIMAGWNDKNTIKVLFRVPPIQKYHFLEVFPIPGTPGAYPKWLKI